MNKSKSAGITLITLILTIILLLILAGITISELIGKGLFSQSQRAVIEHKKAQEEELVRLANIELFMDYGSDFKNITEETVKNKFGEEVKVEKSNAEGIFIITFINTGNVYKLDIKNQNVTFLGTHSDDYSDVEITPQNIKFILDPEGWTNGNVVTTIKVDENISMVDRKLQWTRTPMEKNSWKDYTDSTQIISTQNEEIYARLYENLTGKYIATQVNIQSIDRVNPVIQEVKTTTNALTFKATDDASGIIGYAITETNEEPTSFESCTNTKNLEVTSKNKKQGTNYYVWVKDEANNISSSSVNKTENVGNLTEANTTFEYNPSGWTSGNVKVTVTTTEDTTNNTLRITKADVTTLSKSEILKLPLGSQGIEIDTNNTTVYAILVDSEGQIGSAAAGTVDKIDKNKPIIKSLTQGKTTTSTIEVSVNAEDSQSGIDKYRYSSDGGVTWSEYTTSSNYKLENLTKGFGCSYSIAVEVTDKVGNVATKVQDMSTINDDDYYVATANKVLETISGRNFYKTNSSPAIAGIIYRNWGTNWTVPIIVSTESRAVEMYTSYNNQNMGASGHLVYKGVTFYYSSTGQWINEAPYTSTLIALNDSNSRFTTMEEAATNLLDRYFYNTQQKNYEVFYNANGGSGAPSSQKKIKNQTLTLSNTKPTRSGYHFVRMVN